MKFHPHLHILTNSNIDFNSKFDKLWRKTILTNLKLKSNKYYYGYYVWSDIIKSEQIARYIGRYVRHPPIANGRIMKCNKGSITFFYRNNRKDKIIVKKSLLDFISSIIQHIPPEQFKMIRYYGVYSGRRINCYYRNLRRGRRFS